MKYTFLLIHQINTCDHMSVDFVCLSVDRNSVSVGVDSSGVCAVYAGREDFDPAPSAHVEETLGMFM